MPSDGAARHHPPVLERQHLRGRLETGVVVHHDQFVGGCQRGGQQVGDVDRMVRAELRQCPLRTQGGVPMLVVGRHIFARRTVLGQPLLVFVVSRRRSERFRIQSRGGRNDPGGEQCM